MVENAAVAFQNRKFVVDKEDFSIHGFSRGRTFAPEIPACAEVRPTVREGAATRRARRRVTQRAVFRTPSVSIGKPA
jgi:hypothetical protein